jgi:hypothetical protein
MNLETLFLLSLKISTYSYLLPIIFLLPQAYRQPATYNWLAVCLFYSFATEIGAGILHELSLDPSIALKQYGLFSTIFISFFFYKAIAWSNLRNALISVNVIYFAFALLNLFGVQKSGSNSFSMTFQTLIIIVLSIVFFYKLMKELPSFQLQKNPLFWVVSAFFFSYAGKLVIYTVTHYLVNVLGDNMLIVWSTHNFLTILGNLVISVGVFLKFQQHSVNQVV